MLKNYLKFIIEDINISDKRYKDRVHYSFYDRSDNDKYICKYPIFDEPSNELEEKIKKEFNGKINRANITAIKKLIASELKININKIDELLRWNTNNRLVRNIETGENSKNTMDNKIDTKTFDDTKKAQQKLKTKEDIADDIASWFSSKFDDSSSEIFKMFHDKKKYGNVVSDIYVNSHNEVIIKTTGEKTTELESAIANSKEFQDFINEKIENKDFNKHNYLNGYISDLNGKVYSILYRIKIKSSELGLQNERDYKDFFDDCIANNRSVSIQYGNDNIIMEKVLSARLTGNETGNGLKSDLEIKYMSQDDEGKMVKRTHLFSIKKMNAGNYETVMNKAEFIKKLLKDKLDYIKKEIEKHGECSIPISINSILNYWFMFGSDIISDKKQNKTASVIYGTANSALSGAFSLEEDGRDFMQLSELMSDYKTISLTLDKPEHLRKYLSNNQLKIHIGKVKPKHGSKPRTKISELFGLDTNNEYRIDIRHDTNIEPEENCISTMMDVDNVDAIEYYKKNGFNKVNKMLSQLYNVEF